MPLGNRRTDSLIVLGASGRAAAESAARAGYKVTVFDLFGDLDTQALAAWRPLESFDPAEWHPPLTAVLLAGGFESRPAILDALQAFDSAPPPRFPWRRESASWLAEMPRLASATHLHWPVSRSATAKLPPRIGRMIAKRIDSAGGMEVDVSETAPPLPNDHAWIWQQFIEGRPCSVSLLITRREVQLLGAAQPVSPAPQASTRPFLYRGSIALPTIPSPLADRAQLLGSELRDRYGVRGLVGVDLIEADDAHWLLEVNPRYTASMELFESSDSFVDAHLRAMRGEAVGHLTPLPVGGKRIVFAPQQRILQRRLPAELCLTGMNKVTLHDRPQTPITIEAGEPICTLKTRAPCVANCDRLLLDAEIELLQRLGEPTSSAK